MTQRIKRTRAFELTLNIRDEGFVAPPRAGQRNWLLARAMNEFASDLQAIDQAARDFVPGSDPVSTADRRQADLADDEIMEDWQIPLMEAMAAAVTERQGRVLEIGFGRGIGSSLIQSGRPAQHTIIECNDRIVERFERWRASYPDRDIVLVRGLWQDVLDELGLFDGIFFHTYPLDADEFVEYISQSVTFAEHFFAHAARHLNPGGVFTYLSFEIDSLSRAHQRALFRHFSRVELGVQPLVVPADVRDAWWSDSMMLVRAYR